MQSMTVKVINRTNMNMFNEAALNARSLGVSERYLNAAKFLAYCWLAAIAFVFVPVLHFFLVPMALLAGVIVFFWKIRLKEFHEAVTIICPSCQTKLELKAEPFNWPLNEMCSNCRAQLLITKIN